VHREPDTGQIESPVKDTTNTLTEEQLELKRIIQEIKDELGIKKPGPLN
jgi:hypothetical protein